MKTYVVTVPFTGTMYIEVEAESEEAAIQEAIQNVTSENIEGWNAVEQIVQGNVFYGEQNEAEAICLDADEDSK
jgi:uncharacterized protein (UPF0297 family)